MNRQAIVGIFTILTLLALFGIFLVLANVGPQGRYRIGIHFQSASGLHRGTVVSASGVTVGTVESTALLPDDYTVEVVLAIDNGVKIARGSRFVVLQPLTGDGTLQVVPPSARDTAANPSLLEPLEPGILPLAQQPRGVTPPSITDVLLQGQGEVQRLDRMLAQIEEREPQLLVTLQSALENADRVTVTSNRRIEVMGAQMSTLLDTLNVAAQASSRNVIELTGALNGTVARNSGQFDSIVSMLSRTARSLDQTVNSVRDLAGDPTLRKNILDTSRGLAQTAESIGQITTDFERVTGDAQTQAQLRDTVANVDAATQKLNSLLAGLGGRSNVSGVDHPPSPVPSPASSSGAGPSSQPAATNFGERIGNAARGLAQIQIRIAELDAQRAGVTGSPLLTSDRGPQTDVNLRLLPHASTSYLIGLNDIGDPNGSATWNLALDRKVGDQFSVGGGMLYSRLGIQTGYQPEHSPLSFDLRAYDPRRPTLDAYANYRLTPTTLLFGGERDASRVDRRTLFGIEFQF
jgi:phospholipid/cholesterol/gamma-HCH transport system substrate-binding protein